MMEIQPADSRARRWAALFISSGVIAGVLTLWVVEVYGPALEAWLLSDAAQIRSRFRLAFAVMTLGVALPVLGLAGYFWHLGGRIIRAQQFPLPGILLIRDTVVVRGVRAHRRGRGLQLVALMLAAATFGFAILLWQLLSLLDPRAA